MSHSPERPKEAELVLNKEDMKPGEELSDSVFRDKHFNRLPAEKIVELEADPAKLRAEYRIFKKSETVLSGVTSLWPAHIEDALRIKLGKEGKQAVEEYIRTQAIENPSSVDALAAKLDRFREHHEQIPTLEADFERHSSNASSLSEQAQARQGDVDFYAKRVKRGGLFGFLGKRTAYNRDQRNRAEQARNLARGGADASRRAAGATEALLDVHVEQRDTRRDEVVNGLLKEVSIAKMVREQVKEQMGKLLNRTGGRGFSDIADATEVISKYEELAKKAKAENEMEPDKVAEEVNELVEKRAKAEVQYALGANIKYFRFERLQETLDAFINMEPVGTHASPKDALGFVRGVLEEEGDRLREQLGSLEKDGPKDTTKEKVDEHELEKKHTKLKLVALGVVRAKVGEKYRKLSKA